MRAGFSTHHHQHRRWWPYLYLCLAAMAVLYAISASFYSFFTIPSSSTPAREEEEPKCPHPSFKLPKGERYMLYAPHSGFSNQVGELKNALLVSALLDRTLVLPPVFDHHAVALGSCPKFRVNDASEMRSMAWNHISELIRDGRCASIFLNAFFWLIGYPLFLHSYHILLCRWWMCLWPSYFLWHSFLIGTLSHCDYSKLKAHCPEIALISCSHPMFT